MHRSLAGRLNFHRAASALAAFAAVAGLGACGGGGGNNGPGRVKLGLAMGNLLPLGGIDRQLGASGARASALAVRQIRQAVAEVGADHKLVTVQRDEGADAAAAAAGARALVDQQHASCLT